MKHKREKPAFTLMELLITVAILAVLMSILLPSLGKAKALARKIVCGSNLRQMVQGNIAYSHENNSFLVLAAEDILDRGGNRKRWHGERISSGGMSSDPLENCFNPTKSPMADYLADGGINACPEFEPTEAGFEASAGGYGYNQQYLGGSYFRPGFSSSINADPSRKASKRSARYEEIARPARTIMFTDAAIAQGKTSIVEYSFCEAPYAPGARRLAPTIHFRHDRSCNVGWADGHVDSQMMDFSASYGAYGVTEADAKRLGFGWFGPDNNMYFDLE